MSQPEFANYFPLELFQAYCTCDDNQTKQDAKTIAGLETFFVLQKQV